MPRKPKKKQPTKKTEKAKIGRPSDYTEEMATIICEHIATSSNGLHIICKVIPGCPNVTTVYSWLNKHASFRHKYARARKMQADYVLGEGLKIVDQADAQEEFFGGNNIQKAKLQWEARRWLAGKLRPRKYGDKMDLTSKGKKLPANQTIIVKLPEGHDD